MEEETSSLPPAQPPNRLAKMPAGAESWESVEEMMGVPDSLSGSREVVATISNPAGATTSLTRSTIQDQAPGVARLAEGRITTILDVARSTEEVPSQAHMVARPTEGRITSVDVARNTKEVSSHASGAAMPADGRITTILDVARSTEEVPSQAPIVARTTEGGSPSRMLQGALRRCPAQHRGLPGLQREGSPSQMLPAVRRCPAPVQS